MDLNTLLSKAEAKFKNIHPQLAEKGRQLIKDAHAIGINIIITQGLRTTAEQNALYAQGRTAPGKIVTNAKGGYSYHNFGLAFDFAVTNASGGTVYWDTSIDTNKDKAKDWYQVGKLGQKLGLEWGGAWTGFVDMPHFQMTFGLSLAQLRGGAKAPTSGASTSTGGSTTTKKNYLEKGDEGSDVLALQKKLVQLGYKLTGDNNGCDGIFGQSTVDAVKAFQKKVKITVDGVVGATTNSKLNDAIADLNKKPASTTKIVIPTVTLKFGDQGTNVLSLQRALCEAAFYPDKGAKNKGCDGIYGKDTQDAVKRFQSVYANPADGIYGKATQAALKKVLNK